MAEYEEEWYTGIDGISATRGSCDIVLEKEGNMVVYSPAKLGSFGIDLSCSRGLPRMPKLSTPTSSPNRRLVHAYSDADSIEPRGRGTRRTTGKL